MNLEGLRNIGIKKGINFKNTVVHVGLSVAAIAILNACDSGSNIPTSKPTAENRIKTECDSMSLDQVKKDIIKPQDYLNAQYKCLPEVIKAEESGLLKGIIYQPSDRELEAILRELFSSRANDEQALQYFVRSSIDSYKSPKGHVGVIVPGIIGVFGEKLPIYIGVTETLFSSPAIENDADVRSIIKHEEKHAEDWYKGITLGDIHLDYDTISPETFSLKFLEQLMELRAVYGELEDAFREKVQTGKAYISPAWFASEASNYMQHFNYVKNSAKTDLEKKVRDFQLKDFAGITPEIATNDRFLLRFNLFGKQDIAQFWRDPTSSR